MSLKVITAVLLVVVIVNGHPPHDHHEAGDPFGFGYAVKDPLNGNDFSHVADSNGDVIRGEYRTLMPDGRVQIVKYTADWKNGYQAEVIYEGEAIVPPPVPHHPHSPPHRPPHHHNAALALQVGEGWSGAGTVGSY